MLSVNDGRNYASVVDLANLMATVHNVHGAIAIDRDAGWCPDRCFCRENLLSLIANLAVTCDCLDDAVCDLSNALVHSIGNDNTASPIDCDTPWLMKASKARRSAVARVVSNGT